MPPGGGNGFPALVKVEVVDGGVGRAGPPEASLLGLPWVPMGSSSVPACVLTSSSLLIPLPIRVMFCVWGRRELGLDIAWEGGL